MSDDCKVCGGSGYTQTSDIEREQCERCNGTGKRADSTCPICGQDMRFNEHDEWICTKQCHSED